MRSLRSCLAVMAVVVVAAPSSVAAAQPGGLERPSHTGTFVDSERGFFLCFETDTSPDGTPDCVVGYVVPPGQPSAGLLRVMGGGFQRTSSFTVLDEVYIDAGMLAIEGSSLALHVDFPELGQLDVDLRGAPPASVGWTNASCPVTVMRYGVAASQPRVSPVAHVRGRLSRGERSETIRSHSPTPGGPSCYAFFDGSSTGWWRIEEPRSAAHRRFPTPVPPER